MIQPLYFLPICLQFLWIQLPLSFTTRFIDESFISYHLTWHIPLNKTHHVPSFTLECSNSRPPLAKCILSNKDRKPQRLLRQSLSHYAVQISFFQSFRLLSLLKFQDFAVLLASPNNCHGVSCVGS